MFCGKCGVKILEEKDFCQKCGNNLIGGSGTNETGTGIKKHNKNEKLEKILWISGIVSLLLFPPVGVVIIIIAFVTRHRNGKSIMIPCGIISSIIGFFMTIIGYIIPGRATRQSIIVRGGSAGWGYADNTPIKEVLIFIGIILLVLGVLLLVLRYIRTKK
ncbi:MAG: hypothetical protein FWD24_00880 [Treponema sp.]|nr:hypothetical protein [Treponema sp.]